MGSFDVFKGPAGGAGSSTELIVRAKRAEMLRSNNRSKVNEIGELRRGGRLAWLDAFTEVPFLQTNS